jgi:hypothetical protein
MPRRETNTQRRQRERKRWAILEIARGIAWEISERRCALALSVKEKKELEYIKKTMRALGVYTSVRLDAVWTDKESIQNIAEGLRLAADMLEERPVDGRSFSGHDSKIVTAFLEAVQRVKRNHPSRIVVVHDDGISRIKTAVPTFSEILQVYREQNPRVKVEDRSVRRALERLYIVTRPSKRGRPKKK